MSTKKIFIYLLVILLIIIPFFWLKPGEVNLGGDSSRGYLYQPFKFITDYSLYGINPWNIGSEMIGYFLIPFSAFLGIILSFVKTSHNLVNIFNSFSFTLAFLGTYASIYYLIKDSDKNNNKNLGFARTVGIIGGLFYIFSPTMTNWDKPLLTFNQIFLDPIMFLFLYKYLSTKKIHYAILAIVTTFIFAPNFSFIGAPTFFSFYPFVLLFLVAWIYLVRKTSLNFKQIGFLIILFIGVQSFHLIPQIIAIANPTSIAAKRVFSNSGFNYPAYFKSVAEGVNVAYNFLGLPQYSLPYGVLFFVFPFIIVFSLIQKVKNGADKYYRKTYLLLIICFLLLLFFVSGKITNVGLQFYANLFNIPGFGMFRNFTGQFMTTFSFFYSLVIGFGLYILFKSKKKKISFILSIFVLILLIVRGWPLINGSILYLPTFQSKISTPYIPTKSFENALSYITDIPTDSKLLVLPLNDWGYLMVPGQDGGLYMGSSIIGPLTLKQDFGSYNSMGFLGNTFMQAIKEKDTKTIVNTLSLFNIQDIFWEKDPFIYKKNFPSFPYDSTQNFIPSEVSAYETLVKSLPIINTKVFNKNILLMHLNPTQVFPKIYASKSITYAVDPSDSPFLVQDVVNNPNTILQSQDFLADNNDDVSFEATPYTELAGLYDNLQFHVAAPSVSWRPGSILYPLVIWKEERSLRNAQGQDRSTLTFLYLAKRVEELRKWSNDIPISKKKVTLPNTSFNSLLNWSRYNSWEAVISLYEKYADELTAYINQLSQDQITSQKIQALEQFEQQRSHLIQIIEDTNLTQNNKEYLKSLIYSMFDRIENNLNIKKIDVTEELYTLNVPKGTSGDYEINLLHASPDARYSSVEINNDNKNFSLPFNKNNYSFGNVSLPDGQVSLNLRLIPKNLTEDTKWEGIGSINSFDGIDNISLDNSPNAIDGKMFRLIPITPIMNQYVITFYYNTHNSPFDIALFDKRADNQGNEYSFQYNDRTLISNDWKLYQTVFTIDPDTKSAYVQLENSEVNKKNEILIKDFTVTAVKNPILVFKKLGKIDATGPTIAFQRINPTKYHIFVKNSNGPYVLTFLQEFSKNWKLYLSPSNQSPNFPIVQSYFGGKVEEGGHKNIFISSDTTQTWGMNPIAEKTHIVGDGYANSWLITPEDVNGNKNYDLIIELQTQKHFYIGIIISLLSLALLLFWQIFTLLKTKNK